MTMPDAPGSTADEAPLLDVRNLRTWFHTERGLFKAVDGISFSVRRGRAVGLVGESGCGKSVTSLSLMGLVPQPPGQVQADALLFEGHDVMGMSAEERRLLRGGRMAMVFQEPMTSLNPVHTIGAQIVEAIRAHSDMPYDAARRRALEVLELVRIPSAAQRFDDFPHLGHPAAGCAGESALYPHGRQCAADVGCHADYLSSRA
jgi:peptide/nickel transport system ATP-binding protein/oligopeptide transport system ATP-binding protein